jgi:hypothetical protein
MRPRRRPESFLHRASACRRTSEAHTATWACAPSRAAQPRRPEQAKVHGIGSIGYRPSPMDRAQPPLPALSLYAAPSPSPTTAGAVEGPWDWIHRVQVVADGSCATPSPCALSPCRPPPPPPPPSPCRRRTSVRPLPLSLPASYERAPPPPSPCRCRTSVRPPLPTDVEACPVGAVGTSPFLQASTVGPLAHACRASMVASSGRAPLLPHRDKYPLLICELLSSSLRQSTLNPSDISAYHYSCSCLPAPSFPN